MLELVPHMKLILGCSFQLNLSKIQAKQAVCKGIGVLHQNSLLNFIIEDQNKMLSSDEKLSELTRIIL